MRSEQVAYNAALQAVFDLEREINNLMSAQFRIEQEIATKRQELADRSNEAEAALVAWRLVATTTAS